MVVNPEGLKHFPDNTPNSVASNQWHHVVACFDGTTKHVWVDGREVASAEAGLAFRPGLAPLRIGAAAGRCRRGVSRRRHRHARDLR